MVDRQLTSSDSRVLPPIQDLVPHAPPMLVVEEVTAWSPGQATCKMILRDSAPMVENGRVAAAAIIEYLGQAVAACCGAEAYVGGEGVRYGVIIGCRTVSLNRDFLVVGTELRLEVTRSRGNDMLSHFSCEAHDADGLVARATMTVYHATEMPD